MKDKKIILRVDGGCVEPVEIPEGVTVEVRDYDIHSADLEDLQVVDGEECVIHTFTAPDHSFGIPAN